MYPWPVFDGILLLMIPFVSRWTILSGRGKPSRIAEFSYSPPIQSWLGGGQGVRDKLRLANSAIRAVEQNPSRNNLSAFYPAQVRELLGRQGFVTKTGGEHDNQGALGGAGP